MSRTRCRDRWLLAIASLASLLFTAPARSADSLDVAGTECELGITLALRGRPAAAESVFTSLLSRSPRDARALTNLGNLALLEDEAKLALGFYERARAADSADAGIVLNEATALLLLGDEDAANARAAEGVRMAGGARPAASLLGIRYRDTTSEIPKGKPSARVSKEELLTMLRTAASKVPVDSTRSVAPADTAATRGKARPSMWRSAGPRAGVPADLATLVYWKR